MAKHATELKNKNATGSDNSAVYKVIVALLVMCVGLLVLRKLSSTYATVGGMALLDTQLPYFMWIGFGLAAVCAVVTLLWKAPVCRLLMPWAAFVFFMVGSTGATLQIASFTGFTWLNFLWAVVLVQYIIYQLYHWEFFLFSLPTAAAGFLFYQYRSGFSANVKGLLPLIFTVLILACVVLIAFTTSRNKGCLVFGKKKIRVFSRKYNPFLHYLVVALWVICIPAALLLGSLFSVYCLFAAIAVEFIAAVYYTFQLN